MNISLLPPASTARSTVRSTAHHESPAIGAGSPLTEASPFLFHGPEGSCIAQGQAQPIARGTKDTLAQRIAETWATTSSQGMIGGALPFESGAQDCLWHSPQASTIWPDALRAPHIATGSSASLAPIPAAAVAITPAPSASAYAQAVARALATMRAEDGQNAALEKLVLSRALVIQTQAPIARDLLLARLAADPAATAFQVRLPDPAASSAGQPQRVLMGATPELLVQKTGDVIRSHPLAGSARREADPAHDQAKGAALNASEKDQREHALVVEYILDTLAPDCRDLTCPKGTTLTQTRSMWHLGTRIEGRLKDRETPSVLLAAKLHPTPAVCGVPHTRAEALIRELEPDPRGFYAGAVGWCSASGDGAWYVAIRSAEICGTQARLFAGAGIVAGSDPMSEAAETGAKFGAMLAALGLPLDAGMAGVVHD